MTLPAVINYAGVQYVQADTVCPQCGGKVVEDESSDSSAAQWVCPMQGCQWKGSAPRLAVVVPPGFSPGAFAKWKQTVRTMMAQRITEVPAREKLVEPVLANGGVAIVFDREPGILEHFLPQLIEGGKLRRLVKKPTLDKHGGRAVQNVAKLWAAATATYGIDIGVARDVRAPGTTGLLWQPHAWLWHNAEQRWIETTRTFTHYYGVRLSLPECRQLVALVTTGGGATPSTTP
jgi:predicted RNA-binding Zn-ribbon protein involved in translation (DUF1610 family)